MSKRNAETKRRSRAGAGAPLCVLATLLALAGVPGCFDTSIPGVRTVEARIDEDGVVRVPSLDIVGQWYAYGDAYDLRACVEVGKHEAEYCSWVEQSDVLPQLGVAYEDGELCVSGAVAQLLSCCTQEEFEDPDSEPHCTGVNELNCYEDLDFSNMWGAGIGFDFDLDPPLDGLRTYDLIEARTPWNAAEYKVTGVSFDFVWGSNEDIPLRVEFPVELERSMTLPENQGTLRWDGSEVPGGDTLDAPFTSEEHPFGSPFWQEGERKHNVWPNSPIQKGTNQIFFEDVYPPPVDSSLNYMEWDEPISVSRLLGLQFHVVPDQEGKRRTVFSFCIRNLAFLIESDSS